MNNQNDHLKNDLKAWRDIEPGPGFEDAVWRRIEAAPNVTRASSFALRASEDTSSPWLLRPVFATAAGLIAGVLIGLSTVTSPAPRADELALLGGDSLAGSYLHLVKGDIP